MLKQLAFDRGPIIFAESCYLFIYLFIYTERIIHGRLYVSTVALSLLKSRSLF